MINTKQFIENIHAEGEKVLRTATNFLSLSQTQLNWKPEPEKWSVGECFLHLIAVNKHYLKLYEANLGKNDDSIRTFPFKNSLIGKLIIHFTKPGKMKTKTAGNFDFQNSEVPKNIVEEFIEQPKTIMLLSKKLQNMDMKNISVVSPFNKFIKYNLGDSLEIIVLHDQRHLLQAENVTKMNNFPTN